LDDVVGGVRGAEEAMVVEIFKGAVAGGTV